MTDTQTPTFAPLPSKHHWPEDFEHENGNYNCICGDCGTHFVGHKRRVQCKSCFLTAVIAERDQLKAYALEATIALTEKLNVGGSEFFAGRIGEFYKADIPFCIESAQRRIEAFNRLTVAKLEAQIRDLEDQLTELEKHRA